MPHQDNRLLKYCSNHARHTSPKGETLWLAAASSADLGADGFLPVHNPVRVICQPVTQITQHKAV